MSGLLPLAAVVPIAAAAVAALARGRLSLQRALGFGTSGVLLAYAAALLGSTLEGGVVATQVGGFPPGFAIPFAADLFSALMLAVAALMVLVCSAFAAARGEDRHPLFHPLVLVLLGGIAGAFLTADLFNLFVFFEVMLIPSYVLLTLGGTRRQVRAGVVYVSTNLLASTLLVVGVALVYGAAGTVNLGRLAEVGRDAPGLAVAGGVLLVAFAVKASLVPVHGWLPSAYPGTSPAVAAMFSGLLTKVGVYALYRVYSVVFAGDPRFRTLLLGVAAATMAVGVLGAVGRETLREILSFHITSQVGYMIMGLGLFGPLGLAGGIFYILHHIVVKTSLFLSAGAVETFRGTGSLARLGGVSRSRPMLAASFGVAALSLAGLPPLSGFFAKLLLVQAAFQQGEYGVAAVAIAVGFLTLFSMAKIWNAAFWGHQPAARVGERPPAEELVAVAGRAGNPEPTPSGGEVPSRARAAALVAPALALAAMSLVLGVGAQWLLAPSVTAAEVLVDPAAYVGAVLSR